MFVLGFSLSGCSSKGFIFFYPVCETVRERERLILAVVWFFRLAMMSSSSVHLLLIGQTFPAIL